MRARRFRLLLLALALCAVSACAGPFDTDQIVDMAREEAERQIAEEVESRIDEGVAQVEDEIAAARDEVLDALPIVGDRPTATPGKGRRLVFDRNGEIQ